MARPGPRRPPGPRPPPPPPMTANVWIRESVNGLLPVARVGGEIASYRLLRGEGVAGAPPPARPMGGIGVSLLRPPRFSPPRPALLGSAGAGGGGGGGAAGVGFRPPPPAPRV